MMINCPNCNLLQSKDQYCAGCGVNMETWRPPEPPAWKKIVSNWIFQLTVLFALVLALVLKDSFANKPSESYTESNLPVENSIERAETFTAQSDPAFEEPPVTEEEKAQAKTLDKLVFKKNKRVDDLDDDRALVGIKQIALLKASFMSRPLIDQLLEKGQKLDDNAFLISKAHFNEILSQSPRDNKASGATRSNFNFNKEKLLFIGEEDLETGLKLGFQVQVNINEYAQNDPLQYNISYWSQLQLSGDAGPRTSLSVSSPLKSLLVLVESHPREISFNSDETTLFESSHRLRLLNDDAYQEGQADIVLVLEIK